MRELTVALSAGFCFGVRRAVDLAVETLDQTGGCYLLGELIHNSTVIEQIRQKGGVIVNDVEEIPAGASVVIRAHGLGKAEFDRLERRGIRFVDATCPFVAKIQQIVAQYSALGERVLILGEREHPEIVGIGGWCVGEALCAKNTAELQAVLEQNPSLQKDRLCVVAQTTSSRKNFEECCIILKNRCTNVRIFDTICNATNERQEEARMIASRCDAMIVVGSSGSANTMRLADLCRAQGAEVFLVERASDLPGDLWARFSHVGVTAGASTPAFIIKEVVNTMEEKILNETQDLNFEEELEKTLKPINNGDVVSGIVISINPTEVHVDLGTKHDGIIPISEVTNDPNASIADTIHVGDTVEVFVVRVNDVEGTVTLSKRKVDSIRGMLEVEKAVEDGAVLEGVVAEAVKGGVICMVKGVRVFVPASLAAERYTSDLSTLVGSHVRLRIIEVNKQRRRFTGSIKAVLDEERKEKSSKVWGEIVPGKEYQGVVKSITSYGVFVDIGGVDGMVHISELTWNRVRNPAELVKVGDIIPVTVLSANPETKKISLTCKKPNENPWVKFESTYKVNDIVDVRIVKLMPFGAFAEIIPGIDGLIHISQISDQRIAKPADVLSVDQIVQARITQVDHENHKVNLTIRALHETTPEVTSDQEAPVQEEAPAAQEQAAE